MTRRRQEIADEMMWSCPAESREDHEIIAWQIRTGQPVEAILELPELDLWPETYAWLKGELAGEDNE